MPNDDTDCAIIAQLQDKLLRILAQLAGRLRLAELVRPKPRTLILAEIEAGGSIDLGLDLLKVRPSINSHITASVLPDIASIKKAEKRAVRQRLLSRETPKSSTNTRGRGRREQSAAGG